MTHQLHRRQFLGALLAVPLSVAPLSKLPRPVPKAQDIPEWASRVRRILRSEAVGDVRFCQVARRIRVGASAFDAARGILEMIREAVSPDVPLSASAAGGMSDGDESTSPDSLLATVHYESGLRLVMTVSPLLRTEFAVTIRGESGYIEVNGPKLTWVCQGYKSVCSNATAGTDNSVVLPVLEVDAPMGMVRRAYGERRTVTASDLRPPDSVRLSERVSHSGN